MSDGMRPPEVTGRGRRNLTRRGMIGGAAGVGLAAIVTAAPASASTSAELSGQRFDMVLRVTRAMAQFPLDFSARPEKASAALAKFPLEPSARYGKASAAMAPASAPRLARTAGKLKPRNLAQVSTAADGLLADGLLSEPLGDLVLTLGSRSADTSLLALAAVSVAALAPINDPNETSGFARTWLGMLGRMHEQNTLAAAVTRRGLR